MRETPPRKLVDLLQRLQLAGEGQLLRVTGRVERLSRELPAFESVWVDALAQARLVTPYQAQEINAGRGDALKVGPYRIEQPLPWPMFAGGYQAREITSQAKVWLTVAPQPAVVGGEILGALEVLAAKAPQWSAARLLPVQWVGADGPRRFAASAWIEGQSAAEWVLRHGRMPPGAVLEIARQMIVLLAALERIGVPHGDISPHGMLFSRQGEVTLLHPGLRAAMCPGESFTQPQLRPEAYDYLAPERVLGGSGPTRVSDLFACGGTWWHLLTGRPPLGGGDSRGKVVAAQSARIPSVQQLAPETPGELAAAIASCMQADPQRRPDSLARLVASLGPPTREGQAELAGCLARPERSLARMLESSARRPAWGSSVPFWMVVGTCLAVVAAATLGPALRGNPRKEVQAKIIVRAPHAESAPDAARIAPPAAPTPTAGGNADLSGNILVLPGNATRAGSTLALRPGLCVRGPAGQRARIEVPASGWEIASDGVQFEEVDFTAAARDEALAAPGAASTAMLIVRTAHVTFRGCTFTGTETHAPLAVRWLPGESEATARVALPSGRLQWSRCILRQVSAGLDCRRGGAAGLEWNNVLYLGAGPLVRLDHFPDADEPLALSFARVTARASGPLLECRVGRPSASPGTITIRANQCVWSIDPQRPLLLFTGSDDPQQLLAGVSWSGQGSLLSPTTAVAGWRTDDSQVQPLNDAAMTIAGLVRSEVEFAGFVGPDPGGSQAVRWQVPLRSADPPGIDANELPGNTLHSPRPEG